MNTLCESYWRLWVKELDCSSHKKEKNFCHHTQPSKSWLEKMPVCYWMKQVKMQRVMDRASRANNPLILAATYTYIHAHDGLCGMHNNRLNHVWRFQQLLFLTQSFLSSRLSPENLCFFLLALDSLLPFHPLWRPFCPWPRQLPTPLCACCLLEMMWQTLVTKEVSYIAVVAV